MVAHVVQLTNQSVEHIISFVIVHMGKQNRNSFFFLILFFHYDFLVTRVYIVKKNKNVRRHSTDRNVRDNVWHRIRVPKDILIAIPTVKNSV